MRFLSILRDQRIAKRGQVSLRDMKFANRIKSETLSLLGAILEDKDRVLIEISSSAVPYFLDILDDPAFDIYDYKQVAEDKYEFSNRKLII